MFTLFYTFTFCRLYFMYCLLCVVSYTLFFMQFRGLKNQIPMQNNTLAFQQTNLS
jgi:hypothetical protein